MHQKTRYRSSQPPKSSVPYRKGALAVTGELPHPDQFGTRYHLLNSADQEILELYSSARHSVPKILSALRIM
jgi:hypothetical protein